MAGWGVGVGRVVEEGTWWGAGARPEQPAKKGAGQRSSGDVGRQVKGRGSCWVVWGLAGAEGAAGQWGSSGQGRYRGQGRAQSGGGEA